jgi:hypothetical protein
MNFILTRFYQKLLTLSFIMLGLIMASGCAKPREAVVLRASDAEMGRLAQQAKSLFEMQRPAQAAPLYQAALDRARALDDDAAIARLAYNLGACRLESGDALGASTAFREAIHAAHTAGFPSEESRLLLGRALLKQGDIDGTLILCGKAIKASGLRANPDMRVRFELLQAEACLQADEIDAAQTTLQKVAQQLTSKSSSTMQARAAHVEAVILSRRENPSQSANAFLREAELWGTANRPLDVVAALVRAAYEQQRANDNPAEADSRYRAGRALLGLGHSAEASAQLDRLEALPKDDWPESLIQLVPLLRREIDQRTPSQ